MTSSSASAQEKRTLIQDNLFLMTAKKTLSLSQFSIWPCSNKKALDYSTILLYYF